MGLDITAVRRQYPTMQMIGGINKHALALGRDAIDEELKKLPFMLESGRYLPAVDHFVPPDVSWDNYRYFCERLRDLIERHQPQSADA
jgi:uroporphyrinogen decarboxylase